jgi:hypothetical protein
MSRTHYSTLLYSFDTLTVWEGRWHNEGFVDCSISKILSWGEKKESPGGREKVYIHGTGASRPDTAQGEPFGTWLACDEWFNQSQTEPFFPVGTECQPHHLPPHQLYPTPHFSGLYLLTLPANVLCPLANFIHFKHVHFFVESRHQLEWRQFSRLFKADWSAALIEGRQARISSPLYCSPRPIRGSHDGRIVANWSALKRVEFWQHLQNFIKRLNIFCLLQQEGSITSKVHDVRRRLYYKSHTSMPYGIGHYWKQMRRQRSAMAWVCREYFRSWKSNKWFAYSIESVKIINPPIISQFSSCWIWTRWTIRQEHNIHSSKSIQATLISIYSILRRFHISTYAAVAANTSILLALVINAKARAKHAEKIAIMPSRTPLDWIM